VKKKLFIIIIVLILIAGLAFIFLRQPLKETETEPEAPKKKVAAVLIDELPEDEQPEVNLTARDDGKELKLEIENLVGFHEIEYELTYLTAGVVRGVIGTIRLKLAEKSVFRDLLLGTCSRGVCRYDPNVTGGNLTIIFRGDKTYKYSRDFTLETSRGSTIVVME